jgi:23S rRNA pseudouridine2605 synthase
MNTTGLLVLTTDGDLANKLMHPSTEIEREYLVRVLGKVDSGMLERMRSGVMLDDGMAKFDSIDEQGGEGANHWYRVILKEGRNREVRRLWESQGIQVSRLVRIRYGNLTIPKQLRRGNSQELEAAAINSLYALAGLPTPFEKKTAEKKAAKKADLVKSSAVKTKPSRKPKPRARPAARQGRQRTK